MLPFLIGVGLGMLAIGGLWFAVGSVIFFYGYKRAPVIEDSDI
jgi:hypothetical protein